MSTPSRTSRRKTTTTTTYSSKEARRLRLRRPSPPTAAALGGRGRRRRRGRRGRPACRSSQRTLPSTAPTATAIRRAALRSYSPTTSYSSASTGMAWPGQLCCGEYPIFHPFMGRDVSFDFSGVAREQNVEQIQAENNINNRASAKHVTD